MLTFITDVHALGLETAQGLVLTEAWYWDLSDANREFAKKFAPASRACIRPWSTPASIRRSRISEGGHRLKSDADGKAVVAKMKAMPTDDKLFGKGTVRADGRKIHPMYLFEVKTPAELKGPWDLYKLRATIPAAGGNDEDPVQTIVAFNIRVDGRCSEFGDCARPRAEQSRAQCLFRRDAYSHQLVGRRVGYGNRITGPYDALRYAQGQSIKHPVGFDIKIDTPLDFMGVTDHSEYVGVTREANIPGSYVSKLPEAQPLIMKDPNSTAEQQNRVFSYLLKLAASPPVKTFMDPKVTSTIWKENVRIADENNHPGKFTAFCSYEWTSMPGQRNLHRNVFFRACDKVPDYPFSALGSTKCPTDLWSWMDTQRKAGNELLAISHNANVSDGWMYPIDVDTRRLIDAAWAASRDRNERLVEIKQGKGQSEAHPLLSPNDEFAGYELYQAILGLPAAVGRIDHITGSYGRQALKDGITMQDVRGYNPYKFGMAGGSDLHNTGSPYRQDNFYGLHADADGTVERRFAGVLIGGTMDVRLENPGGLTGVWAEENTRASLWDAMYRKETFGVSGPHIKVRFFGGWTTIRTS